MKVGDEVEYNGHKLDGIKEEHEKFQETTITRRKEKGKVVSIVPDNGDKWIVVVLESGIEVSMSEDRMEIACGIKDKEIAELNASQEDTGSVRRFY